MGGIPLADTLRRLLSHGGAPPVESEIVRLAAAYRAAYEDFALIHSAAYANAEDVLRELHSRRVPMAIVSNKGEAAIHAFLARHGLGACFRLVTGDSAGGPRKPDPQLMHHVVMPAFPDHQVANALMIGDTDVDLRFAAASGAPSCWATYGYGNPSICEGLKPQHRISDLEELLSIVGG
jgi:phosphoglycolate phosphatase